MTVKLTCGDGVIARVQREHFEKSVFNNPDIAAVRSYTLQCKARSEIVNAVVDLAEDESQTVTITEDNFEELQNLCKELGFRGLDKELRAFRGETGRDSVGLKGFLQLKERVTRQEKRLTELERRLNEVLSWKGKEESVSRELQSLERKVEEVARVCEERNAEASRKTERALKEFAKQRDLEELSRDLARLKENESAVQVRPAKSLEVIEPKRSGLPPLRQSTSAKPAPPTPKKRGEFVYDSSKRLEGVIAHLTRECGGNVRDKGIVNVLGTGGGRRQAVEFGNTDYYYSNDANAWICYDFGVRRVIPASYSIRSYEDRFLKFWVIEVSNDGYSWAEIDRRDNNNDLNDKLVTANFMISRVPSESFRFFRLRQTEPNKYGFRITAMEIFGTLFVMEKVEQTRPPKQEFVYHADREGQVPPPLFPPKFDGVIAHLTLECVGNVRDKGIVNVLGTGGDHRQAVEFGDSNYYYSLVANSWICYDFGAQRVIPKSYSIRSHENRFLKFWVIEVSNDGYSWTEIDRRDNNFDLSDFYGTANFKISKVPMESFRFFRLRQTGKYPNNKDGFRISAMEIFGTLFATEKVEKPRSSKQEFVYHADREGQLPPPLFPPKLDGIIAHLTLECVGNVHKKGIVNVTASSISYGNVWCAVDIGTNWEYRSKKEKDAWICYDFKERRVIPTSYSVRSCGDGIEYHLKSWVIEVSKDGSSWTEIDRRDYDYALNSRHAIANFKISNVPSESFRFFRLKQTGKAHQGDYVVCITSLEIFGTLFEK